MKKVITYGTFDLFHKGHLNLLTNAKKLGDYLIVGVTTEHFDEERGKLNVHDSIMERVENVKKTGLADMIIIEDHEGQKIEDIQKYGADIFTVGSDWTGKFDYLKAFCEVVYLPRTPDISSSMLRENSSPIVSLGVVGTGRIAPRFIAESHYVSGLYVNAVYNPHKSSADAFALRHSLNAYSDDYETFLQAVDAVYIATPHETHYDYVKRALLMGKHVICEKPLALSKNEVVELYEIAKKNAAVLMEGIKTAYCPGFAQMINVAKSGRIGRIVDVEACFSRIEDGNIRELRDSLFGGAYLEFGSYTLLPILKLLGCDYKEVRFDSILSENGIDSYTKATIVYEDGIASSKTGVKAKSEGQLVIAGTKGYILAESPWWLTRKFQVRFEDPNQIEEYTPKFMGDGLRYEISEFVNKINKRAGHDFKLTEAESIAMADITERFMQNRKNLREKIEASNKDAKVKLWGHRGCSYMHIENTLPAFKAAFEVKGIEGIELDIQYSSDCELMVYHDENLKRLMGVDVKLCEVECEKLQQMKFISNPSEEYFIPTFSQVLNMAKPYLKQGKKINVELKNSVYRYKGMEEEIVDKILEADVADSIVFSTFNSESAKYLKDYLQTKNLNCEVAILGVDANNCRIVMNENALDAIHPSITGLDEMKAMEEKCPVRVWNGFEPFYAQNFIPPVIDLKRLAKKGVTDLITNVPERYLNA